MGSKLRPGAFDCYAAAEPDEPMFVLLARDPLAPVLVREWADRRERIADEAGIPRDPGDRERQKITEARTCANQMDAWRAAERPGVRVDPDAGLTAGGRQHAAEDRQAQAALALLTPSNPDPTYGRIDPDIQAAVDTLNPVDVAQRTAIENTLQARRDAPSLDLYGAANRARDDALTLAELAVADELDADQQAAILGAGGPRMEGAEVADLLDIWQNADAWLGLTEPWWDEHGPDLHARLGITDGRRQVPADWIPTFAGVFAVLALAVAQRGGPPPTVDDVADLATRAIGVALERLAHR